MITRASFRAVLLLIGWLLCSSSQANAQIIETFGDRITHLGDIPPQPGQPPTAEKVGFKYSYVGLFWIDVWTGDGEFCLYEGNNYRTIDRATAANLLGKPETELTEPLLYRFPLGLLILASLAGVPVVWISVSLIRLDRDKAKASRLLCDPIYQTALEIAGVHMDQASTIESSPGSVRAATAQNQGDTGAFKAGVLYLTDSGVPPEEAVRNLKLVLRAIAAKRAAGRRAEKRCITASGDGVGLSVRAEALGGTSSGMRIARSGETFSAIAAGR